jgi:hypothetical protein
MRWMSSPNTSVSSKRRERVGAEALMHHRERADHRRVFELDVKSRELLGQEQALVDNRP